MIFAFLSIVILWYLVFVNDTVWRIAAASSDQLKKSGTPESFFFRRSMVSILSVHNIYMISVSSSCAVATLTLSGSTLQYCCCLDRSAVSCIDGVTSTLTFHIFIVVIPVSF